MRRIVARQADTVFGRDHDFRAIRTPDDFRRRIPVAGYEYVEPYIARVRRGETAALLSDRNVLMFALTSGTTAARKFVPVTPQYLADYRRGWNIWGMRAFLDHPGVKLRPIVQMSGDWDEFRTEAGIACGAVTGLTAEMQKRIIRWLYCVPACTARVKDAAAKYYLVLRLSLPRDVAVLVAANPSTLINLARAGDDFKESLIRDLRDGTLSPDVSIPADIRAALARPLARRHRERAQQLESIVRRTGSLFPRDYWPGERLVGTWTGGSVGAYLRNLTRYYGDVIVRDVGLIASEGRMTIPLADASASGVLDITSHYFEFLPEGEETSASPVTVGADEVEVGRNYYILPTTAFGLYRYHIHDLIRVTGFHNRTPLVEFLSKGANFSNVTGEKLSEYQIVEAVRDAMAATGVSPAVYSLAPCWNDERPYYAFFAEPGEAGRDEWQSLAAAVDVRLGRANIEYAAKRESGRLGAVRVALLPPGTWQRWDRDRLERSGGTAEQYKHPCLIPDLQFRSAMTVDEEIAAAGPARPSDGRTELTSARAAL